MPAASPDHAKLIRQLETIASLSETDREALAALPVRVKAVGENRDIVREGDRPSESCLILEGLVCRYKMVVGGRRQIVSFHFPGDMPDLQSLYLDAMDHSISALVPTRVAFIAHDAINRMADSHPSVGRVLAKHALIDGSIFREWVANVGRRSALERIALVQQPTFELPLTQAELGDATGLSNVHVNRSLQELRRLGLIATVGRIHSILNWDQLQDIADFRPGYLHLRPGIAP
jgi:CRP-like cAMP-binding protein